MEKNNEEYYVRYGEDIIPKSGYMVCTVFKHNSEGNLEIHIGNQEYDISIIFHSTIALLRDMDEYACFKIWDRIQEKQGDYALSEWSVYLVENSGLIDWINENSDIGFKLTPSILVHYCICAGDRFTDIVTYGKPIITVKKLK